MRTERVDTLLREAAAQLLAGAERTILGSSRPTGKRTGRDHHIFQAMVALYAAASDDPGIRPLLARIRAVYRRDSDTLRTMPTMQLLDLPDGQHTPAGKVCLRYGLNEWVGMSRESRRKDLLAHLGTFITSLDVAMRTHDYYGLLGGESSRVRKIADERATSELCEQLLHAGGQEALLQAFLETKTTRWLQLDVAYCTDLTKIARAYRVLGWDRDWAEVLRETEHALSGKSLSAAFSASSFISDRDDATFYAQRHLFGDPPKSELAHTMGDALACAHGLLRNPPGMPPTVPMQVNVVVTPEAFKELMPHFQGRDIWAGVQPFTCAHSSSAGRDEALLPPLDSDYIHIGAAATLRARIRGRFVEVRFLTPLAHEAVSIVMDEPERVAERACAKIDASISMNRKRSERTVMTYWSGEDVETLQVDESGQPPERSGRASLLGQSDCRHEHATWVVHHASDAAPPYLRLSCRRCLRSQIATAPLHQAPGDRLDTPDKIAHYLRQYRAQAAFHGERLPESLTLQQLSERDQHVELDPTAYAHKVPRMASPESGARRGSLTRPRRIRH